MKIVTVVGARPQFIKSLPVTLALRQAGIREFLLHTGQHYDQKMSEIFFEQLGMNEPDQNLNVGSGSHAEQTAKMLVGIEACLLKERPDALLLFGDTNSTLAGALAAAKLGVPIAHIEAGLRSFDRRMPEEINREVTDRFSHWLFVPTQAGQKNLLREGCLPHQIHLVGDVMFDTFVRFSRKAPDVKTLLPAQLSSGSNFALMTIHRAENTDSPARLGAIMDAVSAVSRELPVLFPIHPRTRKMLDKLGFQTGKSPGLFLMEPQGYLEMLALLQNCSLVITDSGGLQKEAFFAEKSCVVMRDNTEWIELLETDWNYLLPPESAFDLAEKICSRISHRGRPNSPYGDGRASEKIAQILLQTREPSES